MDGTQTLLKTCWSFTTHASHTPSGCALSSAPQSLHYQSSAGSSHLNRTMEKANIASPLTLTWSPNHYLKLSEHCLIPVTFLSPQGPPGFVGTLSGFLALAKPFANSNIDHQAPVSAAVLRQRKQISSLL